MGKCEMKFKIKNKIILLSLIIFSYALIAVAIKLLTFYGYIETLPPMPHSNENFSQKNLDKVILKLQNAQDFFNNNFVNNNKHIDLYYIPNSSRIHLKNTGETNSEAVSYYLLWNAQSRYKSDFDEALDYLRNYMITSNGYLRWRLEGDEIAINDGSNIASDADLRAIKAILIAERQWKDKKYTELLDKMINGLEQMSISNNYFVPYAGIHNNTIWKADDVWLSYSDFEAFRILSIRKGEPWIKVYNNMKKAVISSQTPSGLYNSHLSGNNVYSNFLEKKYSINSMWVMVRAAESGDLELQDSARKSLDFYKARYIESKKLYTGYEPDGTSTNEESPWVYALVGRAAIALGDKEFADILIDKLLESQINDKSSLLYGAIPEGSKEDPVVTQFTMQESILTLQAYIGASTPLD